MDFNFFEPYAKVPEKTNFIRLIATSVIGTLLLAIIGITAFTVIEVETIKKEIAMAEEIINSDAHRELLREFAELNKEIRFKKIEGKSYEYFETYMAGKDLIKKDSLGKISANINDAIFLETISIEDNIMVLTGKTFKTKALADLETVLRDSGDYSSVFLQTAEQSKRDKRDDSYLDFNFGEEDEAKIIKDVYDFNLSITFAEKESLNMTLESIVKANEEAAAQSEVATDETENTNSEGEDSPETRE